MRLYRYAVCAFCFSVPLQNAWPEGCSLSLALGSSSVSNGCCGHWSDHLVHARYWIISPWLSLYSGFSYNKFGNLTVHTRHFSCFTCCVDIYCFQFFSILRKISYLLRWFVVVHIASLLRVLFSASHNHAYFILSLFHQFSVVLIFPPILVLSFIYFIFLLPAPHTEASQSLPLFFIQPIFPRDALKAFSAFWFWFRIFPSLALRLLLLHARD